METLRKLYRAIRKHSGMESSSIIEAGKHGADAGWPGFCYYGDTSDFYRENRELIHEHAADEAESMGYDNVAEMFAGFGRAEMFETADGTECILSWFALESVGQWLEACRENGGL